MHIEGDITVWFNVNSRFTMEFKKVSVTDAIDLLHILQNALQEAKETPVQERMWATSDETPSQEATGE